MHRGVKHSRDLSQCLFNLSVAGKTFDVAFLACHAPPVAVTFYAYTHAWSKLGAALETWRVLGNMRQPLVLQWQYRTQFLGLI